MALRLISACFLRLFCEYEHSDQYYIKVAYSPLIAEDMVYQCRLSAAQVSCQQHWSLFHLMI
ncbi:MAG: hypothetical protein J1E57_05015 [Prevotella sp.]|nr:hypothetical protein [Prevotella sp.]